MASDTVDLIEKCEDPIVKDVVDNETAEQTDPDVQNISVIAMEMAERLRSPSTTPAYEWEPQKVMQSSDYAHKFPWLTGSELREYKIYTRTCFDLSAIEPIALFVTIFYVSHANFEFALSDGPFFMCGLTFGIIASILFYIVFIFAHGVRSMNYTGSTNIYMRKVSDLIFFSTYLEDLIAILATLSAGCYLYARVLKGQCAPNTGLWGSQRCNPYAVAYSIPTDHVLYVITFPLVHQLILRGISIQAVFVCWCISTTMIIASVVHADAWLVSSLHNCYFTVHFSILTSNARTTTTTIILHIL